MNSLLEKLRHSLVDDWYDPADPTSGDRLRLLKCQYTSNVIRALITGTFWTGLLLCLEADDAFIGTIGIISQAAGMLQILGPIFLERFSRRKTMLIWMRALMWLVNVVLIGLIPLCPASQQTRLYMASAGVLIVSILNTAVGPGVAIWHLQSMPERVRGGYYSLLTMTSGAIVAVFTFLGGLLVDVFDKYGMQYYGLLALRGIAAVLCGFELYMYTKIPEYPYSENPNAQFRLRDLVIKPFKERTYLLTVTVAFLWNLTANVPGSYYSVYLLNDLKVSYTFLSLVGAFNVPVVLLLTPLWKRILKRLGWFRTLYVSMGIYAFHYILLAVVTKSTYIWMYPISQFMSFFFSIGITLAFSGIPYVNIPKENQTLFYGFYNTAVYFAAFIGTAAGKYFILGVGDSTVSILGMTFGGKQLIVLLTSALVLVGALGVKLIHEKVHDTMD